MTLNQAIKSKSKFRPKFWSDDHWFYIKKNVVHYETFKTTYKIEDFKKIYKNFTWEILK